MTDIPIKIQFVKSLSTAQPSRIVAVKADGDTAFSLWVTDKTGLPYPLKGLQDNVIITNTDSNLQITSSSTSTNINLASSTLATINSALQNGDNISELINDVGYLTSFVETDPVFQASEARLFVFGDKVNLDNQSGINSGNQTSIVGIAGTKAQFNTELVDGDFLFVGDVTQYTDELAQDAIGNILTDTSTIDLDYNDAIPSISAIVKSNSIDATHLSDTINTSTFINDGDDTVNPFISAQDLVGYIPYIGATTNTDLGEFQIKVGQVEFDQTPTQTAGVAKLRWNDDDGTLNLGLKGGNVTLQIGQEQLLRVVNKTGFNLLESQYKCVYISGAQGNRLKVDLALSNNTINSNKTIGLVTENINSNLEGFITTSGLVRDVDTTGALQGETWVDGDVLYLSSTIAGSLTNIMPISPNHKILAGYVVRAHSTQGSIFVKVDTGLSVQELHNVNIIGTTINKTLGSTIDGLWENKTIPEILGYNPENLSNKQNSLAIDGTGLKYPTVDAINNSLSTLSHNSLIGLNAGDFQHLTVSEKANLAPLASPSFTGTPTAPTATAGTNTNQIATTAFVQAEVATKQNTLVSGTNIKTINGNSILGSGDLVISGGGGTPAGANTQIQYNNSGAFGASSNFTFDGNAQTISSSASTNSTLRVGSIEIQPFATNNNWFGDNVYFNGSGFKYRNTGYGSLLQNYIGQILLTNYNTGLAGANVGNWKTAFKADFNGNVGVGGNINSALGNFTGSVITVNGTSNKVGINNTSPEAALHVTENSPSQPRGIVLDNTGNFINGGSLLLRKGRLGNTSILLDDALGSIAFDGRQGTNSWTSTGHAAVISARASENWGTDMNGCYYTFELTANGNAGSSTRQVMKLDNNGMATLPVINNALIQSEATGKAVITKEYVNRTFTVATLPTPASGVAYATVTDATSPTYLGTLTGGGSVVCPVFYNGTSWVSH